MSIEDIVLEFKDFDKAIEELGRIDRHYKLGAKPLFTGQDLSDGSVLWKIRVNAPTPEDRKFYSIQRLVNIQEAYTRLKKDYKQVIKDGE